MAILVQDEGLLCIETDRIDLGILCTGAVIDESSLCTGINDTTVPQFYRADTTLITADNTSITADYSF